MRSPYFLPFLCLAACAPKSAPVVDQNQPVQLLPPLADPIEPVNRGMWAVNKGLLVGVLQPTGTAYRAVVPKPARQSIGNFSRNITTPGRLINQTLQGRWADAGDESLRFLTNTTAGAVGLFDVATKWDIPAPEASFTQTFTKWGWQRKNFIMLPIVGPSDEVSTAGLIGDKAAEPWTYLPSPYSYGSVATSYNRLTETSDRRAQFVRTDPDAYVSTKYVWSYADFVGQPDWSLSGPVDPATLQTLQVAQLEFMDSGFPHRGKTIAVQLPSTGKTFRATAWMQKDPAPVVYISPGLGSHRLSSTPAVVAEKLFRNGFSVVSTASVFHPEFMESASTSALPAYPPNDSRDLLAALTAVDRKLTGKYGARIRSRALLGLSMGAFQTLYIAANENRHPDLIRFDRYVAIDSPVDLTYGITELDRFYTAPNKWPAASRQAKLKNTVHKIQHIQTAGLPRSIKVPFDAVESQFMIGLNFRFILRDTIFSSQSRNNFGVIKAPLNKWRRQPAYDEIVTHSYRDYFRKFVLPHYATCGVSTSDFQREANLRSSGARLARNPKIRVLINSNDFLLRPSDVAWMRGSLPSSRLTIFADGGHLGNLATPHMENAIVRSLDGLR